MDVKEDTKRSQGGTGRTTASKGGRSSAAKRSSSKTAGGTAKGTRKQTEERKRLEEERRQEEETAAQERFLPWGSGDLYPAYSWNFSKKGIFSEYFFLYIIWYVWTAGIYISSIFSCGSLFFFIEPWKPEGKKKTHQWDPDLSGVLCDLAASSGRLPERYGDNRIFYQLQGFA